MQSRRNDLDYTYFDKGAPKVQEIITEYFGQENIEFLENIESIPDRPERKNTVGAIFETLIFGVFNVSFICGKEKFDFIQYFKEIPYGYNMKEGISKLSMDTIGGLMTRNYEKYEHLSFHPSEINIKTMLGYLLEHLNHLMEEKEKKLELTYYEISEMKICEREGLNYQWSFDHKFEKIEE